MTRILYPGHFLYDDMVRSEDPGEQCSPLLFSGASNLYRYIFSVAQPVDAGKTVTSGTDESVPYDYGFWYRQNRYIL